MIQIESLDDPRIEPFKSLRDKTPKLNNEIIVESEKVVLKLLKSGFEVKKVLATKEFFEKHTINAEKFFAKKDLLKSIIGHKLHHGVIAIANRPTDTPLNEIDDKVLVLNGLTSPENVGTLIRTAAAFKINSIIVDQKSCSPYLRRCIRVSMGNIFSMKVHHTHNLKELLESLDHSIIGTANQPNSKNIDAFSFPKKTALIIGSEGHGMESEIIDICDDLLRIPIDEDVAHLNASCAGSIALYKMSNV